VEDVMRFPKIDEVAAQLRSVNKQQLRPEDAEEGIDVRLQVYPDGDWAVRWGSSDYDQDHRGYWGSSSVPGDNRRFDSKALARDLIEQAKEHFAQGDDEDEEEEEEDEEEEEFEEEEDDVFSDEEMAQGYVISDARGGGYNVTHEHQHFEHYRSIENALEEINDEMEREKFYPNIYYVNDHGNVDLLDQDGNVVKSRV
jgi:hypothetical protein